MTRIAIVAALGFALTAFVYFHGTLDMEIINGPVWADMRGER